MKRATSISLVLLLIAAIMHLSVATHYCGGQIAGSKVSLTTSLAGCGMEGSGTEAGSPLSETSFSKHCCEDVIAFCAIDNNFTPTYSFVPESFQNNFQVLAINSLISAAPGTEMIPSYSNVNPPGGFGSNNVDLSGICVFRI